jgi:hypothetical protein
MEMDAKRITSPALLVGVRQDPRSNNDVDLRPGHPFLPFTSICQTYSTRVRQGGVQQGFTITPPGVILSFTNTDPCATAQKTY